MSMEPPLHEPESKSAARRDQGHTLVLVGYLLIVAALVLGCYVWIAMRNTGGKVMMIVIAVDLFMGIVLVAVGSKMKKEASKLSS